MTAAYHRSLSIGNPAGPSALSIGKSDSPGHALSPRLNIVDQPIWALINSIQGPYSA